MKIHGKEHFLLQLSLLPQEIRAEVRRALETSAKEAVDLMRRFAPDDPSTSAGDLKSSVGYKFGGSGGAESTKSNAANARMAKLETGMAVTLYAGNQQTLVPGAGGKMHQNARLQEFGTADMPANPFFFPAVRLTKKRARARLSRAIRKGAQKAFR